MPGRFFLTASAEEVGNWADVACPEIAPRRNIAPGQEILALTEAGFTMMRWGVLPVGRKNARGRPVMETVINARSETVFDKSAFEGVRRAVVPASGWYEWTGAVRKKTAWRIAEKTGALLGFAAIWDRWTAPGGMVIDQVATVTCEPSADVRDIHHRMGVLLDAKDIATWLSGDEAAAAALMVPYPDGRLRVEEAVDVDWDAP